MDQAERRATDLRLDWYLQPRLEIQRPIRQAKPIAGSFLQWRFSPVPGKRQSQLARTLRRWFRHEARHLVISDDPGQGKTCLSLRLEHLLCCQKWRSRIFRDSLPRMVVHWMSQLPQASSSYSGLDAQLMADPSLVNSFSDSSKREQVIQYAKENDRIIIVLDAFDELPGPQKELVRELFFESDKKVRWIVTGRDWAVNRAIAGAGADSLFQPKDFFRIRIKGFDHELQDQYMARALPGVDWRASLEGNLEDWDELLGLPSTLREIVRALSADGSPSGGSLASTAVKFSSPSDLFCFCSSRMLLKELGKKENREAIAEQGLGLSPAKAARFIERAVGAVALEMALRGHWREVIRATTTDLDEEIDAIWNAAYQRFLEGLPTTPVVEYAKVWRWARNFLEHYQFHGGAAQADLNAQSLVFRNARVHELHVARYLTDFATPSDLRGEQEASSVLWFLGDEAWDNAWRAAYEMPIRTEKKPHGVDSERYLQALKFLFERPIQVDQRRPTEAMWLAEKWLLKNPSLSGMVGTLHQHLAAQFTRLKQEEVDSYKKGIEELLNKENYVLLCSPGSKLKGDTGSFKIGPDELDGNWTVKMSFTSPFAMARYTLTNGQMQLFDNGFKAAGAERFPATAVSWYDAYYFCRFLGEQTVTLNDGKAYRFTLPTEAQWEYACRAGYKGDYGFDGGKERLKEYACYSNRGGPKPVGSHSPNRWGLHDMHGNVSEWCGDWYGKYPRRPVSDYIGPDKGSGRVFRGGNWAQWDELCRSASRDWKVPSTRYNASGGFRLALSSLEIPK